MKFVTGDINRVLARVAIATTLAAGVSACSSLPSWMGGDDGTPAASDSTTADSTGAAPAADQSAANAPYPDLANTPNRPAAPSTPDDQKKVSDSLSADNARQNYSADQLRAGTETAAAPPPAQAPQEDIAPVNTSAPAGAAADATKTADASAAGGAAPPPPAPASSDSADTASAPAPAPSTDAPSPAPTTAVASNAVPAASTTPGLPAVPPNAAPGIAPMQPTDAQLGFQPSKAPPLDASVAQFVPQPILSRYRQTASSGGGAISYGSGGYTAGVMPGTPPTSTVLFANDTTILGSIGKGQVKSVAQSFMAQGGAGYIRVVGHASSNSSSLSAERRMQWDFEHAQARANSVARALIAAGVPATKVLVDASGDENAAGGDSSRRADIFIQS